jgi:hypothetical protein
MCEANIVGFVRNYVFDEASSSQNLYVQPRSRKIRSKIGIGIPRSQSKMYPVAPACLILFVKRISDILNVIDLELFVMRVNLL